MATRTNGMPYYPRYSRDFMEATAGMPFELKGALGLLLDLIYMMGDRGLPDDPHFIAGHLGLSVRKWNSLRLQLLEADKIYVQNGIISNNRADKEKDIQRKYREKQAENRLGTRKNNNLEEPPSNQSDTESDTNKDDGGDARAKLPDLSHGLTHREALLEAMGGETMSVTGWALGNPEDIREVAYWSGALALPEEDQIAVVAAVMARKPDGPPSRFKYFRQAMEREAEQRAAHSALMASPPELRLVAGAPTTHSPKVVPRLVRPERSAIDE